LQKQKNLKFDQNPSEVQAFPINFSKISLGWCNGLVLTSTNELFTWGNPFAEYDHDLEYNSDFMQIMNDDCVVDISCGFYHMGAVINKTKFESELYLWGGNEYRQLGYFTEKQYSLVPDKIKIIDNPSKVYCGSYHTLCQTLEGIVYGFGHNFNKELGDYADDIIMRPVKIELKVPGHLTLSDIICGNGITYMIMKLKRIKADSSKIENINDSLIEEKEQKLIEMKEVQQIEKIEVLDKDQ